MITWSDVQGTAPPRVSRSPTMTPTKRTTPLLSKRSRRLIEKNARCPLSSFANCAFGSASAQRGRDAAPGQSHSHFHHRSSDVRPQLRPTRAHLSALHVSHGLFRTAGPRLRAGERRRSCHVGVSARRDISGHSEAEVCGNG